jgi:hypothetical protein
MSIIHTFGTENLLVIVANVPYDPAPPLQLFVSKLGSSLRRTNAAMLAQVCQWSIHIGTFSLSSEPRGPDLKKKPPRTFARLRWLVCRSFPVFARKDTEFTSRRELLLHPTSRYGSDKKASFDIIDFILGHGKM